MKIFNVTDSKTNFNDNVINNVLEETSSMLQESPTTTIRDFDALKTKEQNSIRNIIYHIDQEHSREIEPEPVKRLDYAAKLEMLKELGLVADESNTKNKAFNITVTEEHNTGLPVVNVDETDVEKPIEYFNNEAVSHVFNTVLPTEDKLLINKHLTGIGATTYYMNDTSCSHVIVMPTKVMCANKFSSYESNPGKYSKPVFFVSTELYKDTKVRQRELEKFMFQNQGKPVSILAVYDSLPWLTDALYKTNSKRSKLKLTNKHKQLNMTLVVDEVHRTIDAGSLMKSSAYNAMLNVIREEKYARVIGISATVPQLKYLPAEFHEFTQVNFKFKKQSPIVVVPCRMHDEAGMIASMYALSVQAILNPKNPNVYIAVNSIFDIKLYLRAMMKRYPHKASDIRVVCSDTAENVNALSAIRLDDGTQPFKPESITSKTKPARITLFTSTLFEGGDILDENAQLNIFSIVPQQLSQMHSVINIDTQIQQIIGRFRNTKHTRVNFFYNETNLSLEEYLTHVHAERRIFGTFIKDEMDTIKNSYVGLKAVAVSERESFIRKGKLSNNYVISLEHFVRNNFITTYVKNVALDYSSSVNDAEWPKTLNSLLGNRKAITMDFVIEENPVADRKLAFDNNAIIPYLNWNNGYDYVLEALQKNDRIKLRYDDGMYNYLTESLEFCEFYGLEYYGDLKKFMHGVAKLKTKKQKQKQALLETTNDMSPDKFEQHCEQLFEDDTAKSSVETLMNRGKLSPETFQYLMNNSSDNYTDMLGSRFELHGHLKFYKKELKLVRGNKEKEDEINEKISALCTTFRNKYGERFIEPTRIRLIKESAIMFAEEHYEKLSEIIFNKVLSPEGYYHGGVSEFFKEAITKLTLELNIEAPFNIDSLKIDFEDIAHLFIVVSKVIHVKGSDGKKRRILLVKKLESKLIKKYFGDCNIVGISTEYDVQNVNRKPGKVFSDEKLTDNTAILQPDLTINTDTNNYCPKLAGKLDIAHIDIFSFITEHSYHHMNGVDKIFRDIRLNSYRRKQRPMSKLLTNIDYGEQRWYAESDIEVMRKYPWMLAKFNTIQKQNNQEPVDIFSP